MTGHELSSCMARRSLAAVALILGLASGAPSQGVITEKTLSVDWALTIARAAVEACRAVGSRVSVTVLGRDGLPQVFLRDDEAGPHTIDLSQRKAYTAFTYRRTSGEQARYWASLPPPGFSVAGTVGLPGGVPIWAGKDLVGAIGVSGSAEPPPGRDAGVVTGSADEKCALAGIAKLAPKLN